MLPGTPVPSYTELDPRYKERDPCSWGHVFLATRNVCSLLLGTLTPAARNMTPATGNSQLLEVSRPWIRRASAARVQPAHSGCLP